MTIKRINRVYRDMEFHGKNNRRPPVDRLRRLMDHKEETNQDVERVRKWLEG